MFHGQGDRFLQPFCPGILVGRVGRQTHLVNDHLDVVVLVTVNLHAPRDFRNHSVDADMQVAFPPHALEKLAVVTFPVAYQWCKKVDLLFGIIFSDHAEHLLFGIFHHLLTRSIAIGRTGTGKEQTEEVVHFGGGSYRGTWILIGGLLFDADHRTQSGDLVHSGSFHSSQEVSGVSREGLDVPPLSFGKDCVESQ